MRFGMDKAGSARRVKESAGMIGGMTDAFARFCTAVSFRCIPGIIVV